MKKYEKLYVDFETLLNPNKMKAIINSIIFGLDLDSDEYTEMMMVLKHEEANIDLEHRNNELYKRAKLFLVMSDTRLIFTSALTRYKNKEAVITFCSGSNKFLISIKFNDGTFHEVAANLDEILPKIKLIVDKFIVD